MNNLKYILVQLRGIDKALGKRGNLVAGGVVENYNNLVRKVIELTGDTDLSIYEIKHHEFWDETKRCNEGLFLGKLTPFINSTEFYINDNLDKEITEALGMLVSIKDEDLNKRCVDILKNSNNAYDRVINQATQVLEDKIKKKAKLDDSGLIGIPLVSKAIHSNIDETILKFSEDPEVQKGWSLLFKGIIGVYRNETHHGISDNIGRDEALKFSVFIDSLIEIINNL